MTRLNHQRRWVGRSLGCLAILGIVLTGQPQQAAAQDNALVRQIEQLRKDMELLQRYVYREGVPEGASAPAAGGGSPAAARQQVQLDGMQGAITQVTGQIEELDFRIRKIEDRLERLVGDVDFRLSQLEGGTIGAAPMDGTAPDAAGSAPAASTSAAPAASGNGQPMDNSGTRLFGVIENQGSAASVPSGTPAPASQTAAAPAGSSALPAGTPEEQYRYAFDLLRRQEFAQAETALGAFVEAHPEDPLAGNAQYWLGETYYVRGQFEQAAVAFTEGFQTYPDSSKAADNLLKLGMSLGNLGQTEDACTTFAHLLENFPNTSSVILDRARQEQKNRKC
ncbi:tol-pal system protein YbgF [Thalassospira sp.]|uniref:tol-pal system protein YbgF n=1 Tax=Thalassospira sp. TaxID=1912094 RepID=UPI0027351B2E|nr:tol-pal system protein YbgF [Thalassospira sp.]MDP2697111.1 tol-pal system protein YbgF [Thalassospira sp.]